MVAEEQIDLRSLSRQNNIYVFQMVEESGAAGGRAAGFGGRTIEKIFHFRCGNDRCEKVKEFTEAQELDQFEVPHYAARLPVTLPDGSEEVIYGVFEPDVVARFNAITQHE